MIHSLKMVNWRSHGESLIQFSPATNLLIGSIGSGKTSCLDAICFALFGTFPSLRTRRVSLEDTVTAVPGIDKGVVELVFTAGDKRYTVTRAFSAKGTDAFLRDENGRLLEGPQPIRASEAVARLLKLDYELFSRVVYGEQNKLDYFLTLPKGERKKQLDEAIGIAAFETARASASTVVSRLRAEKGAIEQFFTGVDLTQVERDLTALQLEVKKLQFEEKTLSVSQGELTAQVSELKKNIESLQEMKKLHGELSSQLVKAETEAESLKSSADSLMPVGFSISREECTSMLEQCVGVLQERADIEQDVSQVSLAMHRLKGEVDAVNKSIESSNAQRLAFELPQLEASARQLEQARDDLLEAAKKTEGCQRSISLLEKELAEISAQLVQVTRLDPELKKLHLEFASISKLEQKAAEYRQRRIDLEKLHSAKLDSIEKLEKALFLLSGAGASCPTCGKSLEQEALNSLISEKNIVITEEVKVAGQIETDLAAAKSQLESIENNLAKWVELIPLESRKAELDKRHGSTFQLLASSKSEFDATATVMRSCRAKVTALQLSVEKLEKTRLELSQVEKNRERFSVLSAELKKLEGEFERKSLALSSLGKKEELEAKLTSARDALKAYDLLERRAAALAKAAELSSKLSSISFDERNLYDFNSKLNNFSAQLQGCSVSLQHARKSLVEKTEYVEKLHNQHLKLKEMQLSLEATVAGVQNVQLFQNSLVETQATLRTELIGAVNETMAELWPSIYPYRDYKGVRLTPTEDDYLLQLLESTGEWKAVERASGGEKTCASLCLRVALAMVLVPNLNWLVLDEPTHNLDREAVSLLARALHYTLPEIVKQTFVVTHDEALKEGASGSVHVFHRDKDKSGFTVVETL